MGGNRVVVKIVFYIEECIDEVKNGEVVEEVESSTLMGVVEGVKVRWTKMSKVGGDEMENASTEKSGGGETTTKARVIVDGGGERSF